MPFRDDGRAPNWHAQMFAIQSAGKLPSGERLCQLTRAVNPEPFDGGWLLASIVFPVSQARVAVLNAADDRALAWLWGELRGAGVRLEVCVR
jgi:hypothetical protein